MSTDLLRTAQQQLEKKHKELEDKSARYAKCLDILAQAEAALDADRKEIAKLEGAIAALTGEPLPALTAEPEPAPEPKPKKPKPDPNNPYAELKCSGCGGTGTLRPTNKEFPSGRVVPMLICPCGNERLM